MVNSIHYIRLQYKYGGTCSMETPRNARNDMETKVTVSYYSRALANYFRAPIFLRQKDTQWIWRGAADKTTTRVYKHWSHFKTAPIAFFLPIYSN